MLVGILSDSHGQHLMVRRALSLFDEHGVECVIHCGDVCGVKVFDELVGRPCHFVWGNMDDRDAGLEAYLKTVGLNPPVEIPLRLTLDGKRFAVFHGHESAARKMESLSDVDYVLHGHSHECRDERFGGVRIINPGALFRAATKTVAILDLATDALTFHEIAAGDH